MFLPATILAQSPTLARIAKANSPATSAAGRGADMHEASQEWARRPAEERFWSLDDAAQAAQASAERLTLRDVSPVACDIAAVDGKLALRHLKSGNSVKLSALAFEQVSRLTGAPAGYLAKQDATLAAACLSADWTRKAGSDALRLQINDLGTTTASVRAITSPHHDLTTNASLLRALGALVREGSGWKVPPGRVPAGYEGPTRQATSSDVLVHAGHAGLGVQIGDTIAPSGVYCSDRDCFALLVDDSPRGQIDAGGDGGMSRFVMVSNSEVGLGALDVTTGWLRSVCGNHILWGTEKVASIRAVHRGDNASRSLRRIAHTISTRGWGDDRAEVGARVAMAQACQLAKTKDELIGILFAKRRITTKQVAADAWDVSHELAHIDGAGGTAWSVTNALTRMSQLASYSAEREALDTAAAKILDAVAA